MESPLRPEAHLEGPAPDEVERVKEIATGQLLERGIEVPDDTPAERLAELVEAVEGFEDAAEARACDSFTNSLASSAPDDPDCVLPRRRADESIESYIQRVRQHTEIISQRPDR